MAMESVGHRQVHHVARVSGVPSYKVKQTITPHMRVRVAKLKAKRFANKRHLSF